MLPYFWYLLKVMICSGILFGYYWLFLRNKIFHQYNRFYLLAAMLLSLLLPLLKINFWQPAADQSQAIRVLQAVSAGDEYISNIIIPARASTWSFEQLYPLVYCLVSLIFFVVMLRTIYLIRTLLKKYAVQQVEEFAFVNTEDDSTPFSFLKYIFWNSSIDINSTTGRQIFKHEVAHIEEKHTYDKLFVNTVLIFCWCNPFFWLYRKELNMIHEFIADKKAVENSDTAAFAAMILQAAYPKHRFELTNNFFYSPIKRRLLMLTKNNNPKLSYIARLMVLPLAVLVFAAFTFKAKSIKNNLTVNPETNPLVENRMVPENGLPDIVEQNLLPILKDTLPDNVPIDPEKALLIINGKIIGRNKKVAEVFNNLVAQSVTVTWLNRKEAIAKYGSDGLEGACELNYIDGAVFTTAYADADKMSVFYIGIENPIKINVPNVNPEDLVVSISEGSISGTNGNYNATFHQIGIGQATIKLTKRDGTIIPASFTAKIKYMPDPSDPDLPSELRKNLKYDSNNFSSLKQKLIEEQQAKILQDYSQQQLKLSASDLLLDKVVEEKKLTDRQLVEMKQKLLLQEQNIAKLNPVMKEKLVLGQKLNDQQVLNQKLILDQQAGAKLNKAMKEKLVLGQKLNDQQNLKLKEALVVEQQAATKLALDKKLNNLELLKAKQKLILDQQANPKLNIELAELKANELALSAMQQKELLAQQDNKVFTRVETNPQFTGGQEAWIKYMRANLKINTLVDKGAKAGKYTVVLKFIVNADGSLSNITCENDPGFGACEEAIRFIKATPEWQPAIQNGIKVNAYFKQPITFVIANDKGNPASWNKIKDPNGASVFFVSVQPKINFSNMTGALAYTKSAMLFKLAAAVPNKVCSNIVQ